MKNISELAELIFAYYPKLRKIFRNLVSIKDIPISMTQLTCLHIINQNETLSMSELADSLNMSNQQLTKVVDALWEYEMADRVRDGNNKRKYYARITAKGKQTLAALKAEVDRKLGYFLRKKTDDEIDKLYDCIAYVASFVGYKDPLPTH